MTSNGTIERLESGRSEDLSDDDTWGSDFDESCEELYSQEIEDNKINENLEAQQRNVSKIKPTIRCVRTDNPNTTTPVTTEGLYSNISIASTGAIPKRGFSYLSNACFIQQGNLVNHAGFQKSVKPEPKDKNIEALNETRKTTANPSTSHFVNKNLIPESSLENHEVFQRRVKPEPKDKNIEALNETRSKITENLSTSYFVDKNLIQESNLENHTVFQRTVKPEPKDKIIGGLNETKSKSAENSFTSRFVNRHLIQESNREIHKNFQKAVKPQPRDNNIEEVNETKSRTFVIPTTSSTGPLGDVKVKNEPNFLKAPGTKNLPGKLRPEAFNFLNRIPTNNDKDIKDERKHLVPTAFIHTGNLHRSQSKIENQISFDSETNLPEPSAPLYSGHENYESVGDKRDKNENEPFANHQERFSSPARNCNEIAKPALPSRPPPILKHFSPSFTDPVSKLTASTNLNAKLSISSISVKEDLSSKEKSSVDMTPEKKKTRSKVKSSSSTISSNLISRPLPSPPVFNQINSTLEPKSTPSSPLTPEIISRPLPPVPISDPINPALLQKSIPFSPLTSELISRPLSATTTSYQQNLAGSAMNTAVDQTGTSNEKSSTEINTPPTNSPLHSFDTILEAEKPTKTLKGVTNEQLFNEQRQSTQKRLTQIIGSQSQVSSAVIHSQQSISSAIASRLSGLQKDVNKETNISTASLTNSLQNISCITDDEEYLQSFPRSTSTEIQKPKIPPRKVSSSQGKESPLNLNNSNSENPNPPHFTDVDALHSSISRPSLPQKLKTTQRSVSCSSLVQSFRDMSFAMWIPPAKEKRISAGSPCFDASPKEFTKENTEKIINTRGFSVPNADTSREVTAPKPIKSIPDSSSEMNMPSRHAWYHDVDAREAQRRLLNFIDQNGAFLIRPSTRKTMEIQHTACIVFSGRIINMHIRRKRNGRFALGTEKEGEQTFPSIYELIKYHQEVPIESSGHQSSLKSFSACLRVTPPKP